MTEYSFLILFKTIESGDPVEYVYRVQTKDYKEAFNKAVNEAFVVVDPDEELVSITCEKMTLVS